MSPNHREALTAISSISGNNEYVYSTNHALDVSVTGTIGTSDTNLIEVGGSPISLGQTTMSASIPVTLASNQSALSVSAAQSGNWSTRTLDGSGNSIGSTGGALNVSISSGNITGYATSANQTNGSQLTQIVDAGGDAVTVTGGKLDVNAVISGSGGGTSSIDKAAFAIGTDTGTPAMGIYQSSLDTISDGTVAVAGLTPKRGLFVNLQTAAGTETGVAAVPLQVSLANTGANATAVKVDGTGGTFPISGTVAVTQSTSPWIVAGGGTAGSAATGVVTVQGISSMTPVQVSQATASNLNATVVSGNATGSAVPSSAYYLGVLNGAGNLEGVRNAGATTNTTTGMLAAANMAVFDDVSPTSITENSFGSVRMSANRNLYGTIRDAAGNERGANVNASNELSVTIGSVTATNVSTNLAQVAGTTTAVNNGAVSNGVQRVTIANDSTGILASIGSITSSVVPGTAATNLGKAEDVGHTTGDTGVFALAVRTDAQANSATTTGDYSAIANDSAGGLYVTPSANAGVVGASIYNNTALSSTKQAANASAGNMYGYHIYNPNSVVIYVQLFNVASASVTVGTTAPTAVLAVPPLGWADASPATPIAFSTALTIAATTTATGSGTPTTALLCNIWYK